VNLYQRFFDAAKLDLEAAKVLKDKQLYQPSLYHLQQAYEKCIKSYYILKEVELKNTPETTAYKNVVAFKHETEKSTIALVKDTATLQQDEYKDKLPYLTDQQQIEAVKKIIAVIDNYKSSLDKYVQRLDVSKNYVNNILHYSNSTTAVYKNYQNSKRIINNVIIKQPDNRFLYIFSSMTNVYLVLYKMELITRYPLEEFSYKNLDMLANQHDACEKIIEMLDELFNLVSGDLK
jgi:HEPN domain-containing protein